MFNKRLVSVLVPATFASGCAQIHTEDYKEIRQTNNDATSEIDNYKSQSIAEINGGATLDDFFIKTTPIKVKSRDSIILPDFLPKEVSIYSGVPLKESEFSQILYNDYGIKVVFNRLIAEGETEQETAESNDSSELIQTEEDGTVDLSNLGGPSAQPSSAERDEDDSPMMQDMLALFGNAREKEDPNDNRIQTIDYTGTLHGLFNWLALDRGLSWKYDDDTDTFVLYDLDTVVFELIDNTDTFSFESTVDTANDSSSGSSGGTSSSKSSSAQKVTLQEEAEHWEDIKNMINQMLSPNGKSAFDLKNGRVAITDYKQSIQKIGSVIDKINISSGTQVVLNLTYVKISLEESSEIGVNLSATDLVSGAVKGGAKLGGDLSTFGNIFNLSFTKTGVDAMIGSLSRLGSISYRYDAPILTMNNHLTPFQSVEEEHYISEVEVEKDEDGKESKTPKKEINKTGITSTWKNRVLNDRVLIDGKLSLVENLYMKVEEEMNNMVLPKNALDTHNIKSILRNGETRVVSIQEINRKVAESSGPFGADSYLLGGSEKTKNRREVSVILVTPYIIK